MTTEPQSTATPPEPFGYKTSWFAVRSTDTSAVVAALELHSPEPAGWEYGVYQAYNQDEYCVFVTPPVGPWTLALGVPVVWEADDFATERRVGLSRVFGEAQLFSSVRTSDVYEWAQALEGTLVRRFYRADGTREESGEQTEAERALDFRFFDPHSPEANNDEYWSRKDLRHPDEEDVLRVAAAWSVDPTKLDAMGLPAQLGVLASPSESYKPKPSPQKARGPAASAPWWRKIFQRSR